MSIAKVAPKGRGIFAVGGVIKSLVNEADEHVVRDHLSALLQVRNLVILFGSGASFHVGSPHTRDLDSDQIAALVIDSGDALDPAEKDLLRAINVNGNADLEKLLNGLQLATTLAEQNGMEELPFGVPANSQVFSVSVVVSLRRKVNKALAFACELPKPGSLIDDPLSAHRSFFQKVVRSRRANLPRARVFTTNYDLLIERSLDELGFPYIDGFSGTVDRRMNLAYYGLDYHRVETTSQNVVTRADNALYLYKIHGSLNWRARSTKDRSSGLESLEVVQVDGSALSGAESVLIYPTSAKEGDSLSYPYSDLMRMLGEAIQQPDTAIITVGYGYWDPHINRILLRGLVMNPALNVLVADPMAVLTPVGLARVADDKSVKGMRLSAFTPAELRDSPISNLVSGSDSRIAVLTGEAGAFTSLADLVPDVAATESMTSPSDIARLIEALGQVVGHQPASERRLTTHLDTSLDDSDTSLDDK